jgi:hypothetical protein
MIYKDVGRNDTMAVVAREDYQVALDEHNLEVRNMVLAGLEQVKSGNTKDFNEVCERLENKYKDASVYDRNE